MQSSSQIITTNKPTANIFAARMPFLSPNQHCQSTEGNISHYIDLLTQSLPGYVPTLSLTTNSSRLPWRRVAMPFISPLMPVKSNSGKLQEAQLMLTNPRDSFRGQSRSSNIVPFHMLGIVSSCAIVTLSFKMRSFSDIRLQKMS